MRSTESERREQITQANRPGCVLLAGSARGGTSWVLKVLDSHPKVCGCHEPFYQLTKNAQYQVLLDRMKAGQGTNEDAAQLIQSAIQARVETHKPPFFSKDYLYAPKPVRTGAWFAARAVPQLSGVFNFLATGRPDSRHRLVIKNRPFPALNNILNAISADAIILLRHPCGVVSSWLRGMKMGVMDQSSADATRVWEHYSDVLSPLGLTYHDLTKLSPAGMLAINYLIDTQLFEQYRQSGMRTQTIVYCDLLRDPQMEWGRVFEWMGLQFCPQVNAFLDRSSKPGFDLRRLLGRKYSYFSVQRGDRAPEHSWKQEMSSAEIDEVLSVLQPYFPVEQYWPTVNPRCRTSMLVQ